MDRDSIEKTLRAAYERRAANDPVGAGKIFAPNAVFRVVGEPACCGGVRTMRGADIHPALVTMIEVFPAKSFEIASLTIEGNRACVLCKATFTFGPTGETVHSELGHFWTFENGFATEVVEFLDTALVAHLQAKAAK
jgi:ketosteroid isomerase-like protein